MKTFTLQLGKKITKKDLEKAGYKVSDYASDILKKVKFGKKRQVEIVIKEVREFGFTEVVSYKEIIEKAKNEGLELCPAEVGPTLRMSYKNQLTGEWLIIAMNPITDSDGSLRAFSVDCVGRELWLRILYANPGHLFDPSDRIVFVLPRKLNTGNLDALESRPKSLNGGKD